ncbi:MAG: hypothetical protein IPG05_06385 [Gemmatimonadetes bacterium]|nr:hypothetical protein [Gemmatimonadota bacterium]
MSARRGGVALKLLAGVAMLAVVGVVVFNQFILPTLKPTAFVIGSTTGYRGRPRRFRPGTCKLRTATRSG